MIKQFLEKIENALAITDISLEFDIYNELESWYVKNDVKIYKENAEIAMLGYKMQDQIAEMEYMEDNSRYIAEIKKIYEQMQEVYKTMKRAKRYNKTFNR